MKQSMAFLATCLALLVMTVSAQAPQVPAERILSFDIHGINASMMPDAARRALLDAGYSEKGGGDDWGKVPVATFRKDDIQIGLSHRDGKILGITATRIARNDDFDYTRELARIRSHFGLGSDAAGCNDQDHGARCGLSDGVKKGARFMASLTTRMIHLQVGAPR